MASFIPSRVAFLFLAGFLLVGFATTRTQAEESTEQTLQSLVRNQIKAFSSNDAKAAFALAAPSLKQRFGTAAFFMATVRSAYSPVYRPRHITFGLAHAEKTTASQEVFLQGEKGKNWRALYQFEQQQDGTWRISGCFLAEDTSGDTA